VLDQFACLLYSSSSSLSSLSSDRFSIA
jgi:hypothetical protein